jgi:hypothetical protein
MTYQAIQIVTFNVHLESCTSSHVPTILFGMHALMSVIGQQLVTIQLVVVAIIMVRRLIIPVTLTMEVDHLIRMDEKNAQQLNARNDSLTTQLALKYH